MSFAPALPTLVHASAAPGSLYVCRSSLHLPPLPSQLSSNAMNHSPPLTVRLQGLPVEAALTSFFHSLVESLAQLPPTAASSESALREGATGGWLVGGLGCLLAKGCIVPLPVALAAVAALLPWRVALGYADMLGQTTPTSDT